MAGAQRPAAPADADPSIPPKEASFSAAPEESIDAARRLQRVRANLRLPGRPFAAPSTDHDAGLRALRLLDFVRLDLPSSGVPRPDLVAELIANYSSSHGWSSVRGRQVEVSLDAFAKALRLPPYGTSAGIVPDGAAVASAAREFAKVYILEKRRLPSICFVKNVKRGPDYVTEILWELVKEEMEHLVESESTDWVSYYAAFLQRLIWVESSVLFRLPPEPSVEVAPAALCVGEEQGSNRAAILENQKRCSGSDIRKAESSSEQIGMASKKIDSVVGKKQKYCPESHMQEIEARSKKIDTASLIIDAEDTEEGKLDARAKQLREKDDKLDARSRQLSEKECKLDARS
jgi:hypothetical protein